MDFYGTLGASCRDEETLYQMFRAGMTGARLNLSHTTLAESAPVLASLQAAARRAGVEPKLIIDLRGPELRVGVLSGPLKLREGAEILMGRGGIPVTEATLRCAQPGREMALDDGALLLKVLRQGKQTILCRVLRGGTLKSRKNLAILGVEPDTPALTAEDLTDLDAAGRWGVTHILQPFVRGTEDLNTVRKALDDRGLGRVKIMAKIENRTGLARMEQIAAEADEVCIARGDLGNSMALWKLPRVQKDIAACCRAAARPFCLVTQLLWSMEQRPVPTRAEVMDVYNGVLDGAASLMLTGETAVGRYPVQAMDYLVRTARTALE